jgi:hypothetical protein
LAIDDPVAVVMRQIDEEIDAESYVTTRLKNLGLSIGTAIALAKFPVVSQIMATLLVDSPARFEKRLLRVLAVFEEEFERIRNKIPDENHYHSEQFQSMIGLLVERLHTTHEDEKLKMFGKALANSGSSDFKEDPREDFIRIVRDLSLADLNELQHFAPGSAYPGGPVLTGEAKFRMRRARTNLQGESLSRTARLIGFGLVHESLLPKEFDAGRYPTSRDGAARAIADAVGQPPRSQYQISRFGWRFLEFIKSSDISAASVQA